MLVPTEAVTRIYKEVAQYPIERLHHNLDLLSRFSYMNSPEDSVTLKAIRERLTTIEEAA